MSKEMIVQETDDFVLVSQIVAQVVWVQGYRFVSFYEKKNNFAVLLMCFTDEFRFLNIYPEHILYSNVLL